MLEFRGDVPRVSGHWASSGMVNTLAVVTNGSLNKHQDLKGNDRQYSTNNTLTARGKTCTCRPTPVAAYANSFHTTSELPTCAHFPAHFPAFSWGIWFIYIFPKLANSVLRHLWTLKPVDYSQLLGHSERVLAFHGRARVMAVSSQHTRIIRSHSIR